VIVPAPAIRLAAFRILVGAFAVGYLIVRLPYFLDVTRLEPARWDPPGPLAWMSGPLDPSLAQAVLGLTILVGLAATLGWRYRVTGPAFAVLLLGVLTYRNSWSHLFHSDNLLALHALIVGFAPAAAAWSLDARRRADAPTGEDVRYGWPLRLAALVTVLTYVVTGIAKLRYAGGDWLSGDTLLHQITFDNARKKVLGSTYSPLAGPLADHPGVIRPFGLLTLVVELGAPVALLGRRWALAWASAAWLFHLGIVVLMAITFPYPLSLVAFAPLFRCERPFLWVIRRRARQSS
jgi:Vitamin K-dependent gamma-carboxylase